MRSQFCILFCLALGCVLITGCFGSSRRVERKDASTELSDLSGNWNAEDSRQVAEAMIKDALEWPWYTEFRNSNDRKPMVQIGHVRVDANEPISVDIFTDDLRRAFIKESRGTVGVVAKDEEMEEMRAAQAKQEERATEETRSRSYAETGADFRVIGSIKVQDDALGRKQEKFYSIDLIMTNIQTGEQVWMGNKKIAKDVDTSKYR